MNKVITLIGASIALITLSGQALALNPQPEPPGKNRVLALPAQATLSAAALRTIGSATGGAADIDGDWCGTKVPGHIGPHVVGPVSAGALGTGARFADADDNYCGTRVPGHLPGPIHFNGAAQGILTAH